MMQHLRYLLLICLLLVMGSAVTAQDFPMVHFTMQEGLPSNKVYSVYRDNRGYMWLATDKGVARYNGIKFELFTTFNGLPDNEVFFFQQDNAGRLWLATYNGELCYYKDDTFHTAANTPFLKLPFKASFIRRISLEADSSVSIAFWKSASFINIRQEKMSVINLESVKPVLANAKLLDREKLSSNRYRLYFTDGIMEVDSLGNTRTRTPWPMQGITAEELKYWNISFTQNQSYFLSEHYLFERDGKMAMSFHDTFQANNTIYIVYHNSLSYFFGTNNGVIINGNMRILKGNQVSCITQSKEGDYWASTLENGVYVMDKYFMNTRLYKDVYKGKVLYTRALSDHVYFAASDNNLYQLEGGRISTVFSGNRFTPDDLKSGSARATTIDSTYRYFYADTRGCLLIDNLVTAPYRSTRFRTDLVGVNQLSAAAAVGNSVFVNAGFKVLKADLQAGKNTGMLKFGPVSSDPAAEKIFGFAKAPDNTIWYSTVNNVYKVVDGKAQVQQHFINTPFKFFDFFGEYLVGYTHNNKFLICKNYNSEVAFNTISGQNCIWDKMYWLDADHVLISTNNNYRLLTLSTLKMTVLENPLVPLQAESICSDGENVYFFKSGSVTAMEMSRLVTPPDPPKLFFTYLRAGGKLYRIHREVQIPFGESKNITASFSTISFGGNDVSYFYSVSKNEDVWQPLSGEEINLVNPGSGYYTIKVKARSEASGFSAPIVCTLYVGSPFWARWWFITICLWGLVAAVWGVVRYRLRIVLRKKERIYQTEIKFMKSEYKAMNALMNPHFIFNTLNNVQSLVNANDKKAANEYLRIFADLIRQNMQNISKELIPLQKEVDLVSNYLSLEKLRFEDKLTYSIEIKDEIDLSEIMIPPLLIQPLVENSIKHGILPLRNKKGIIKLIIFENENGLYIEVRDNGVGMKGSTKKENPLHESFGLENIRKRIEQLGVIQNKKITFDIAEIESKPDNQNWTVVTIFIPFE